MDDDILREEGLSGGVKAAWAGLLPIFIAIFALRISMTDDEGRVIIVGVVFGVAILGMIVAVLVGERPNRFVSRGPYSRGQLYTNAPPQVVMPALVDALNKTGVIVEESNGTRVVGRRKVSFGSWGSRVFVDLRPSIERQGLGVVTVAIRPSYPLQVSDWGRGIKTATRILQSVPGIVDVRDPSAPRASRR